MKLPLSNDFLDTVKPAFAFLTAEQGYALVPEAAVSAFDNGSLIYESPRLRVQVVRDRGQVSFDVRARGDYRDYDAEILALLLADAREYVRSSGAPEFTAAAAAGFLRAHLVEVERLFSPSLVVETTRRGDALKTDRGEKLFGPNRDRYR